MGFPKFVYKRGTGKKLDDNGMHTAESELVLSQQALEALGEGWCESPVEAGLAPKAKPDPGSLSSLLAAAPDVMAQQRASAKKGK